MFLYQINEKVNYFVLPRIKSIQKLVVRTYMYLLSWEDEIGIEVGLRGVYRASQYAPLFRRCLQPKLF